MLPRRLACLLVTAAIAILLVPGAGEANHIGIRATVTAQLVERVSARAWKVEVSWNAICAGSHAGAANFQGSLYLVDLETHERTYLGGVSGGSGTVTQLVYAREHERQLRAELEISCFEDGSLHSSGKIRDPSDEVTIPPSFAGGGGGAGSDYGSGDPTEPLRDGGCEKVLQGTPGRDRLNGSGGGDVIFGYGAGDRLHGRGGHDCLIGGSGNDRLYGQGGYDVLTGGRGKDVLVGGAGRNSYDAGPGRDYVNARNRRRELVRCGRGRDRARVDRRDRVRSCERVSRSRR